jgi:N-acetylmuramoyl-L-alanine amidase
MASVYLSGSTQKDNIGVNGYGTEADNMQHLANVVKDWIGLGQGGITVFRNNADMGLQGSINDSNNSGADIHIALHTNAGGGRGTEAYYWGGSNNTASVRLTRLLYDRVAPLTAANDRGVKSDHTLYSSGLAELRETNAVATLIEIMYHDNAEDVADYKTKVDAIAQAIAFAVYDYFGIQFKFPAATDKEVATKKLRSVSSYADKIWIPEFEKLEARGLNIWGLINKL